MKLLLILSFILTIQNTFAQDTLREQGSNMYGRYFVLLENNRFEFHFNHCTGESLASGNYEKRKSTISFEYDSIPEPKTEIIGVENEKKDTVKIKLFDITDSSRIDFFQILYGNEKWITFDGDFLMPKANINQDSIQIKYFNQIINVSIENNYSVLKIYVFPPNKSYTFSGISKLKRKDDFYYHKIKFRDHNKEKPWRKGKLRRITYKYKIEKAT
jgi:hypothetical protein